MWMEAQELAAVDLSGLWALGGAAIAAFIGLGTGLVTVKSQAKSEHQKWLRAERLSLYSEFFAAVSASWRVVLSSSREPSQVDTVRQFTEMRDRMFLLGPLNVWEKSEALSTVIASLWTAHRKHSDRESEEWKKAIETLRLEFESARVAFRDACTEALSQK